MSELIKYQKASDRLLEIINEHMQLLIEHMEVFSKPNPEKRLAEIERKIYELQREKRKLTGGAI